MAHEGDPMPGERAQVAISAEEPEDEAAELRLEAATMALYVTIVLIASLSAIAHGGREDEARVISIVWGTTVGLASSTPDRT